MNNEKLIANIGESLSKQNNLPRNIGILDGSIGVSLFYFKLAHLFDKEYFFELGNTTLQKTFHVIEEYDSLSGTFCSGLAGFGWGLLYFQEKSFIEIEADNYLNQLDGILSENLKEELAKANLDFLHGASGLAYYFIKRYETNPSQSSTELKRYIKWLDNTKKESEDGFYWDDFIDMGEINLSLSHGLASVIIILCKIYSLGIETKQTQELIEGSINYVLKQKAKKPHLGCYFPQLIQEDKNTKYIKSRLAWCYGDLGIALAIWHAGTSLSNHFLKQLAKEIFIYSAERKQLGENAIKDAGLCHGTAGIAQIFQRMYLNTQEEVFKNSAAYWVDETLKMAKFTSGLAGYKTFIPDKIEPWKNTSDLISGVSGIGLALMSFQDKNFNDWDQCLLIS